MEPASAPSARSRRQRGAWPFAPVALVALATLAALGCAAPTPVGPPTFGATVDDPEPYTVDEEITPLVLPAATGGSGALTYSLTPEIPGLEFDAGARELRGTPTETGTYDMTYTARDEERETASSSSRSPSQSSPSSGPSSRRSKWATPPACRGSRTCRSRAADPPWR